MKNGLNVFVIEGKSMLLGNRSADRTPKWRVSTRSFAVLLAYTLFIWWLEVLDLLAWLLHLPQGTIVSRVAALFLCGAVMAAAGRFEWERTGISPVFIAGSLFILAFFTVKGFAPDQSYDTQNYHLLSQIPGFVDNLHYHVIPGRFQMFGFRLGDRMFYPFRALLGLRMGTLLNALAMLVIYRQVTVFLSMAAMVAERLERNQIELWISEVAGNTAEKEIQLHSSHSKQKRKCNWLKHLAPVLAFLIVSRLELIQEGGSYMVELLALPFLMEMVFLLVRELDEAKREREAVLFCLFGGILFCLKMTNIVYLIPLVLLYLWKIRKYLTPKLFLGCLVTGAIPVSVYLIYNGIAMKNPVYPYYNSLFHSPYFGEADFKDPRWGPGNIKEYLLWAYSMIRHPDYRLSEIPAKNNLDLALMYLGAAGAGICWIGSWFRSRTQSGESADKTRQAKSGADLEGLLFLMYAASFILWAATTGHSRYFMGGLLFAGMLCGCLVLRGMVFISFELEEREQRRNCLNEQALQKAEVDPTKNVKSEESRKRERSLSSLTGGVVFAVMFILVYAGRAYDAYTSVWNGREWAMRVVNRESIRSNLPYVFRDHQLFTEEERSKIDRIFLTWADVGSYARLAGEDVPVWNRYSIVNELSDQKDAYIDTIEAAMEVGEGVYDMIPQGFETLEGYLEWMNEAGWYVNDMEYQETILQGAQSFTLAGFEMAHGRENRWYRTQDTLMDAQETEKDESEWLCENTSGDDHPTIRAILCDPDYWILKQPFEVEILASDGINSRTAAVVQAGQQEYEPMEVQLDLTGLRGEIKLELVSAAEGKRAVVINPEWSAGTTEE